MSLQHGRTNEWVKSSYSTGNGACVEVKSPVSASISVRDSKVSEGPELGFPAASWGTFVTAVTRVPGV
ncbi:MULTISPECIES: DUF397 domain-containing protein [unclassified Streptomyces]|uniref:DUF397 domain-containing protein n=1 Tax=Streptomyces evansiae TaxID=3075535 RepID=A0ABU2RCY6_9ACTN|nr:MULTISPECIES: DUF397 domain-containing protein [unclassified Streptomyces]ASY34317.1 DUF397 domain-containing protein [Streptomyces sp. CLI2509]EFL00632.1 conserved hypothetical protein [Streptomyces sp. SPB78]EGJ76627.1 hypothetical protein STTU_3838 [Streptomyces sp. Tu6071]MDT0413204.1 DUF397 domain-containing protein [Streptomyces sp. DSM 41979]MDT0425578.1 DUF397 domain-containing protein [Streptomyces sp. DSM 41859]